jgi:transposase
MSATETISSEISAQYASAVEVIAAKDLQIAELAAEVKRLQLLLNSVRFGSKSERRRVEEKDDGRQASLFGAVELPAATQQPEVEEEIKVPAHTRKARKRYTDNQGNPSHFPEHLERRDTNLTPDGPLACEKCGADKEQISTVVTEKIQTIPAQYYVERINKPVLACKCCRQGVPVKAASPDSVLPVSVLGVSFIAYFIVQKFAWHLPFFRQSQMLAQLGIEIDRDVLINTAIKVAKQLEPIVRLMAKQICKSELVHIDETPCVVGVKKGKSKSFERNSYFWPILADGMVVFHYTGDRKHGNVTEILGDDFKGIVMSDGYQAYQSYAMTHPDVSLALCWDHARRKFFEISELEPLAKEVVDRIGYFYRVERDIKELGLKPSEISAYRKKHTLDKLNEFLAWIKKLRDTASLLPKSKLLEAFNYVINHWDGLTVYLDHGIVPISNIAVEQQIRNLKLGAKNWLFAASEVGAETVAIFNSLVCTCKMNGINILEYLTDVLGSLDKPASALTPIAWAKARASATTESVAGSQEPQK